MGIGLDALPNVYLAGLSFDYTQWAAGTRVTLCNVPWGADYRDVVAFGSQAELDRYLSERSGPTVTFDKMTYARVGDSVKIPLPHNDAYLFNYLRVENPAQPVGETRSRVFYYFISDIRHRASNTTELSIQVDVWQSFIRDVTLGSAFVERGHVLLADNRVMNDNGRQYLTQPEGFDIGSEYQIENVYRHRLTTNGMLSEKSADILVISNTQLYGDVGSMAAPKLKMATGTTVNGVPSGADIYLCDDANDLKQVISALSNAPWVSQGIVGIMAIPSGLVTAEMETVSLTVNGVVASQYPLKQASSSNMTINFKDINLAPNFRDNIGDSDNAFSDRYRNLDKFKVYPYSIVELTTYSGTPLVLKPECVNSNNLAVRQLSHIIPPNPRVAFFPLNYNSTSTSKPTGGTYDDSLDDGGEYLDMQTGLFNLPTFSTLNNSYIAFMAGNANSLNYQHTSADWSQQRAMTANQLGYDQSTSGMGLTNELNNLGVRATLDQNTINNTGTISRAVLGGLASIGTGASMGAVGVGLGAAGAAQGAANAVVSVNQNNQSTAVSTNLANKQTQAALSNSGYVRDTNKDYADFAAKGDYANTIGAINARVQDAKLVQPTTSGQVGGDAFNLATNNWSLFAKQKIIDVGARFAIGEYWLRYGYAVNRFAYRLPETLMVMEKFTYWRLKELYVTSSRCPESFKQTIRGIFEKGVTVWSNPDYIGNTDLADNEPIRGEYL